MSDRADTQNSSQSTRLHREWQVVYGDFSKGAATSSFATALRQKTTIEDEGFHNVKIESRFVSDWAEFGAPDNCPRCGQPATGKHFLIDRSCAAFMAEKTR